MSPREPQVLPYFLKNCFNARYKPFQMELLSAIVLGCGGEVDQTPKHGSPSASRQLAKRIRAAAEPSYIVQQVSCLRCSCPKSANGKHTTATVMVVRHLRQARPTRQRSPGLHHTLATLLARPQCAFATCLHAHGPFTSTLTPAPAQVVLHKGPQSSTKPGQASPECQRASCGTACRSVGTRPWSYRGRVRSL